MRDTPKADGSTEIVAMFPEGEGNTMNVGDYASYAWYQWKRADGETPLISTKSPDLYHGETTTYEGEYFRISPGSFFTQCYDRTGYLWDTQKSEVAAATVTVVGASVLAMALALY